MSERQKQAECRAAAGLALDRQATAERSGELPTDGEPEASAFAAPLGSVEGLEDASRVLGRDPDAVVLHRQLQKSRALLGSHRNMAGARRRTRYGDGVGGVSEQVDEDLA